MPVIWDNGQPRRPAARWHDGQIRLRAGKRVKGCLSFRDGPKDQTRNLAPQSLDAGFDAAHRPGMTTHVASTEARKSSAFSRDGKRPSSR
jgi:hypothetical protein